MAGKTVDPDALLNGAGDPTAAEIAAASGTKGDEPPAAPRRGPGRPAGSKNKTTSAPRAAATAAGAPKPERPLTGAAKAAAERRAAADSEARVGDREMREILYAAFMANHRIDVVKGVCMVMSLPAEVCIGAQADPADPSSPLVGEDGRPLLALTAAGAALAPTDGQIATVAKAGARLSETEQGRKLLEWAENAAPYFWAAAAVGAAGMYLVGTFSAAQAIKAELAQAQLAAQQDHPPRETPGAGAPAAGGPPPVQPDLGVPADAVA